MIDVNVVDIPEQPDPVLERNKLEAKRVTAHWKTGNTKALPDYGLGPLFLEGEQQRTIFDDFG